MTSSSPPVTYDCDIVYDYEIVTLVDKSWDDDSGKTFETFANVLKHYGPLGFRLIKMITTSSEKLSSRSLSLRSAASSEVQKNESQTSSTTEITPEINQLVFERIRHKVYERRHRLSDVHHYV